MFNEEENIKKQIKKRLESAPRFYLYCSVCARYLCCSTVFQKYVVHFDCNGWPIKYYNLPDNPPPTT